MKKYKFKLAAICTAALLAAAPVLPACTSNEVNTQTDEWKITLDFDDGVSRNGAIYVEKEESVQLPSGFVREGYQFVGWKTEDGKEVSGEFTPTSDVTLVAQWEVGKNTVTFDPNFEGGEPVVQEITYGTTITDPPVFENEGFALRYWSTSADGAVRLDLSNFVIDADRTLYAIWRDEDDPEYTITFDCGNFEGAPEDVVVYKLASERLFVNTEGPGDIDRPGYEFVGWTAQAPEGDGWTIDDPDADPPELVDDRFYPTSNMTLHAVYQIGEYTAVFNTNYTDSSTSVWESKTYLSNQPVQAPATAPTRENYVFDGWYTSAKGGELVDFSNNDVFLTTNGGYYAHWKHEGVKTDIFQAEYVEFDPLQEYWGYSGSVKGAKCIVQDTGTIGTVMVDKYPLNSVLTSNKGYYVSYQYEKGNTLRFEITSSKATSATLVGSFAVEGSPRQIGPDGEYSNLIKVNGESIDYSPIAIQTTFKEYSVATIQLKEGLNVIEIVVNNSSGAMGGTYKAVGFMTDYIKFTNYGDATFTWSPIYDNLEEVFS